MRDTDAGVADLEAHEGAVCCVFDQPGAENDLALLGEFHGVADQVGENLTEPDRVACQHTWHLGRHKRCQLEPLTAGGAGQQLSDLFDGQTHVAVDDLEVELASLDLREVEDVVQDDEQVVGAVANGLDEVPLLVVQLGAQQQLGHADNAVHRRAELMAHVGEELRFEAGRFERRADQPGVLNRDRCLIGERRQVGQLVLAVLARRGRVECEHADHLVPDLNRQAEERHDTAVTVALREQVARVVLGVGDEEWSSAEGNAARIAPIQRKLVARNELTADAGTDAQHLPFVIEQQQLRVRRTGDM